MSGDFTDKPVASAGEAQQSLQLISLVNSPGLVTASEKQSSCSSLSSAFASIIRDDTRSTSLSDIVEDSHLATLSRLSAGEDGIWSEGCFKVSHHPAEPLQLGN